MLRKAVVINNRDVFPRYLRKEAEETAVICLIQAICTERKLASPLHCTAYQDISMFLWM